MNCLNFSNNSNKRRICMYNLHEMNEYLDYLNNLNELLDNDPENEELLDNFKGYLEELENSINCLKKAIY